MTKQQLDTLASHITSELRLRKGLGEAITNDLIGEAASAVVEEFRRRGLEISGIELEKLKFSVGLALNVSVGESSVVLHNPDLPRWFDGRKHQIQWDNWEAFRSMLLDQGRSEEVVDATEEVINDILDYAGDPTTKGAWARKGLVMGNVQSGKTQNYIGLINKAFDCGYKTVILLGGHLNDLRRQTQERVDEGVLGRKSKHLTQASSVNHGPIGVGAYRVNNVNTGTTTMGDFNKAFADKLGFSLQGSDPVIFTIKKNTAIMERLFDWIKEFHYLDPDSNKRLEGPLLLIDDEADYASINTKHHKEEVTKTNEFIRKLLSLFHRSTYVGYTATPFANIFIDPDDASFSEHSDLFPSDFMIKIPVPDNYIGQDHFFPALSGDESSRESSSAPTIPIYDHDPIFELKKHDQIVFIPESLKEAIRAFLLTIAIRALRGDGNSHNTMLVNISHLVVHQNMLEVLITHYLDRLQNALAAYGGLDVDSARKQADLKMLEDTFHKRFSVKESYEAVFSNLSVSAGKVKVWAVNQSKNTSDDRALDYSLHSDYGLCAIVIGGHKLSRGLTLEGLTVSYFARNSKAYDTLMQMCRWFGYRPGYVDLCKVYLPEDSIDWYTYISSVIRELYQELELMSRRQQRPSDFGLKVREHPGAMIITAKNKLGAAEQEVRSQDLWGQIQRRFRFWSDEEKNGNNIEIARKFLAKLSENGFTQYEDSGAVLFHGAEYEDLVSFIEKMDLPEDDLGNRALTRHLRKMQELGLGAPRVVLYNQPSSGKPKWEKELDAKDREFLNAPFKLNEQIELTLPKRMMQDRNETYSVKSIHLGNKDDEKLFLSAPMREEVQRSAENDAISFDYLCSDARDFPGLIIYFFGVAVKKSNGESGNGDEVRMGHGHTPSVGYTVSIPRSENLRGKTKAEIDSIVKMTKHSYLFNKIQSSLKELGAYEEYSDDD